MSYLLFIKSIYEKQKTALLYSCLKRIYSCRLFLAARWNVHFPCCLFIKIVQDNRRLFDNLRSSANFFRVKIRDMPVTSPYKKLESFSPIFWKARKRMYTVLTQAIKFPRVTKLATFSPFAIMIGLIQKF